MSTPYWKRQANKAMTMLADTYQAEGARDASLVQTLDALQAGEKTIWKLVQRIEVQEKLIQGLNDHQLPTNDPVPK